MEVNTFLGDLGGLPRWPTTHLEHFKNVKFIMKLVTGVNVWHRLTHMLSVLRVANSQKNMSLVIDELYFQNWQLNTFLGDVGGLPTKWRNKH